MSHKIIDGVKIADLINQENVAEVASLAKFGIKVKLVVVRVGEDPASKVYVNMKIKKCAELGIESVLTVLPIETSQDELLNYLKQLNQDKSVNGVLVQLPLPKHIDEKLIIDTVVAEKDVDCFHPINVGKMLIGDNDGFFPCTPYGVLQLLQKSNIATAGKHAIVIGRSNIVGKPMAALLIQKGVDATVTICHSRTKDMAKITQEADIIIAAVGIPEFVKAEMVREGAVVIDVGINRVEDNTNPKGFRICGDVDFAQVAPKCEYITPVPGGVGPMTIAMLMKNTIKAAKLQNK